MTISQFKATCLRVLADLNRHKKPLTITKNGKPLAVVYPYSEKSSRAPFGVSRDSVHAAHDLVAPVIPAGDWGKED